MRHKYKAWDGKEMHTVLSFWVDDYDVLNHVTVRTEEDCATIFPEKYPDFALIQFTGLLDKNGKEIYEGDVLTAFNRKGEEAPNKFFVFWNEYTSAYSIRSINEGETLTVPISPGHFYKDYEVIGNIYEHPHLLNSTPNLEGSDAGGRG